MFQIRKAAERGHADLGWLDTWHTFSFADYHDPQHMRFRSLCVMNEDRIAPGMGFGTHPPHDMEIVTCVLSGSLERKDSMGNGEVLLVGEFQRMTDGVSRRRSNQSTASRTRNRSSAACTDSISTVLAQDIQSCRVQTRRREQVDHVAGLDRVADDLSHGRTDVA